MIISVFALFILLSCLMYFNYKSQMSKCGQGIENYIRKTNKLWFLTSLLVLRLMCLTLYVFMLLDKWEFEYHDFMSVYCSPWVFNKILQKPWKQRIFHSVFALSLYSLPHKFTLTLTIHKGKSKGKKTSQQDITVCGNRRTVTYVRIYYSGGFHYGQVHF